MHPTLLIGLDGATFSLLDHLMEDGVMPFLKEFVAGGVRAELLSTANPLTPPAWISMVTGRNPGSHGVFDFIWAEQRKADHYFTLYNFRDIRCETIWSIVSRQNGRAGSLNFTMMSPPPQIDGYIVPGLVSWKHLRRNTHPRDVYEEIKSLPGFNLREFGWDFDMEKKAEQGVAPEDYENWVQFHIRRERQWFEAMHYLQRERPCDLSSILFDGVDKISHMGWRFLDPAVFPEHPTPWEQEMRQLCLQYFRELDQFLKEIITTAGENTRVFMGSDHGFGPSWFTFRVNTWLESKGYLVWRNIDDLDDKEREKARKLVDKHFVLLDWNKTTAYARTVTSNGIYIPVADVPGKPGVQPEDYEAFRAKLIEELYTIREPISGTKIIKRVMTREEVFPGENNEQAPDLTLVMEDYSFVSILNKTPSVVRRPEIAGTHYPEGIFLAAGPGICKGKELEQLSIVDVAPALLHSLGLEIPSDFEGRVPEAVFESDFMKENPVRFGAETLKPDSYVLDEKEQSGIGVEENKEIMAQLQALGYIE